MTLRKTLQFLIPVYFVFCSSCLSRSFFHSPVQGATNAYHAMPVASDEIKSATYASGAFSVGSMNSNLRDNVYSFQGGLHRSHVLGNFRLNYGASGALGSYHVNPYVYYSATGRPDSIVNRNAGNKFFGDYGAYAGISAATQMGRRGEWRFLGVEGSLFNEFGKYYDFRKALPDSVADEIDKHKYIGSIGLNTEFVFKGRSKNKAGIKVAAGSYLRRLDNNNNYYNSTGYYMSHDDLWYFSVTSHFTFKKTTVYFQLNAATHAAHFQLGFNYRL